MMIDPSWIVGLGAILFGIGLLGTFYHKNAIVVLMCIELMLNSANLNFVAGYIILISGLLVSRIPTFSIKRKGVFIQSKLVFLVLFSIIALSMINFIWITINVLALIYLLSIPLSIIAWQSGSE